MGDLSIKNVPDAQIAALRARAERNHRTLEEELRALIDNAVPSRPKKSLDEIIAYIDSLGLTSVEESTQMIREDRDR